MLPFLLFLVLGGSATAASLFQRPLLRPEAESVWPVATPQPIPVAPPVPAVNLSVPTLEQQVYEQINQYRRSRGLPTLVLDLRVSTMARLHSQNMANRRTSFGHNGMRQRALTINRVIPSRRVSENVAYIFSHNQPAQRAVAGWLRSASHRSAIEDQFSLTGIGVAQDSRGAFYFTQIFVRPR
ncbi:hypothetical protein BST81_26490 [Leptolyngbya sp. 'hensonii']|nr:hypothetical protein BST81_26490 [Leptolyngbya sp. 'hensonii']